MNNLSEVGGGGVDYDWPIMSQLLAISIISLATSIMVVFIIAAGPHHSLDVALLRALL